MKKLFLLLIISTLGALISFFTITSLAKYKVPNREKHFYQNIKKITPTNVLVSPPITTPEFQQNENYISAYVTRVIDGDTIEIQTGERIRYIGIDTPEIKHKDKRIRCLAQEAKKINISLVLNKTVQLKKDVSEIDKFGRLLRYVFLNDEVFVNEYIVREGYAYASPFAPDVMYESLFREAQTQAQENKKGLWSEEKCK